jgi:hypothetical protein
MKSTENVENAIKKNLNFTAGAELHDRMLYDVMNAQDKSKRTAAIQPNIRRQKMFEKSRAWKVAAVITLICTGMVAATAVGVKIYNWRFIGKDAERGYLLRSDDGQTITVTNIPEEWADSAEDAVEVKEELDLLKQQDDRELVGVVEREVNGQLISRYFIYKYVLADGREIKSGDFDPGLSGSLAEAQEDEVMNLLRDMKCEELDSREEEVMGCTFVFKSLKFVLSDGTEVIWACGNPKDDQ